MILKANYSSNKSNVKACQFFNTISSNLKINPSLVWELINPKNNIINFPRLNSPHLLLHLGNQKLAISHSHLLQPGSQKSTDSHSPLLQPGSQK